jgi:two-component system sensor histidine kinase VicK
MLEDITVAKEYIINADKFNAKKNATLEILSHDLAGFFALLQQLSDYVAREMQPNADANLARVLASMQRTSQEGVNLIRDFVDNEFMESAEVDMKSERCDLVGMAKTLLDQYREDQHLLKKTFSLEVSQPTIFAVVDFNKMQQVLNNLLSNAIKFTPDGGNIGVQLTCHSGHITMAVCDTGIGIPPEHLPVLFDRFTKARRPGLRGEKTTGLGMSIIRTLVELHQGTIRVESVVGEGTRFFIELPLAPGE